MKKVAAFAIVSVIILGTIGERFILSSTAEARPDPNSTRLVTRNVLRSGSFVTTEQDHPTSGTARIVNENGQRYLELDSKFTTAKGPDVQVILYRANTVPVKSITEQNYIVLSPLKSFSGTQRYNIPTNVNLDDFKAVGIWCRQFNVTFGYANL